MTPLRRALVEIFEDRGDPERASTQQTYMKSALPFHGISVPNCRRICREQFRTTPFDRRDDWSAAILDLWRSAEHREERYAAIELLTYRPYRDWLDASATGLIEELVVTGAWWDLVDGIAANAVGRMLATNPVHMKPVIRRWSRSSDMWLRRTAILSQLKQKARTDEKLLYACIRESMACTEFFLRKGIGWALREYSKTAPESVLAFVEQNEERLAPLSKKEALKVLTRRGVTAMPRASSQPEPR